MLDLILLTTKEGIELLYNSQKKRFQSTDLVDKSVELHRNWKESISYQFKI